MLPAGLEPTDPARERPETYALDSAASGIGSPTYILGVNEHTEQHQ
jgi:hypothetical protein